MSQVNLSNNSVVKENLAIGGTPTASSPAVSPNQPVKEVLSRGTYAWDGDDMTDNYFGPDMMSGQAPGFVEGTGIAHFKGKVLPTITH